MQKIKKKSSLKFGRILQIQATAKVILYKNHLKLNFKSKKTHQNCILQPKIAFFRQQYWCIFTLFFQNIKNHERPKAWLKAG